MLMISVSLNKQTNERKNDVFPNEVLSVRRFYIVNPFRAPCNLHPIHKGSHKSLIHITHKPPIVSGDL